MQVLLLTHHHAHGADHAIFTGSNKTLNHLFKSFDGTQPSANAILHHLCEIAGLMYDPDDQDESVEVTWMTPHEIMYSDDDLLEVVADISCVDQKELANKLLLFLKQTHPGGFTLQGQQHSEAIRDMTSLLIDIERKS